VCGENGCEKPHHKFLHGKLKQYFAEDILMMVTEEHECNLMEDLFSTYNDFSEIRKEYAINSMVCYLVVKGKRILVNVILDSGSNASNIDGMLISELGLKPSTPEFIRTVQYVSTNVSYLSAGYDIQLTSISGDQTQAVRAYKVKNFKSRVPDWHTICKSHEYLKDIPVLQPDDMVARISLGTDCSALFHNLESRHSVDGTTAIRNTLGWSFLGKFTPNILALNVPKNFETTDECKNEKSTKKRSYDSGLNDFVERSFEVEDWNLQENDLRLSRKFKGGPKPMNLWSDIKHFGYDQMEIEHVNNKHFLSKILWLDGYENKLKNNFKAVKMRQDSKLGDASLRKKEIIITSGSFLVGKYSMDLKTPNQTIKYPKLGAKHQEVLKMEQEVWKHFIQCIPPEIPPRTEWYKISPELKPGDVVIEEGTPKGQWRMAGVEETQKSQDQVVRLASIRTNRKVFDRHVVNLFPLFDDISRLFGFIRVSRQLMVDTSTSVDVGPEGLCSMYTDSVSECPQYIQCSKIDLPEFRRQTFI